MDNQNTQDDFKISEQSLDLLFENMMTGFAYCQMIYDSNGVPIDFVYRKVNQAFGEITGLKEVVGKKVTDVIPDIKLSQPDLLTIYGRVASGGASEHFEMYFHPLSVYLSITVYSPQKNYFVAIFENISERKNAEMALRKNEERFTLALKAAKMGIWDWNMESNIVYWSPEVLTITGKETFDGTLEGFSAIISPEDRDRVNAEFGKWIETGEVYEIEFRITHANGNPVWISSFGRVFYDDNHKPLRMITTAQDITERKKILAELEAKTAEMEKFFKLTVGREIQMADLKKKIREIEKKDDKAAA